MHASSGTITSSTLAAVARIATIAWAVVSGVNFVVWLAVCLASGHLDGPWFLYAVVTGGIVVGALRLAAHAWTPSAAAGKAARAPETRDEQSVFAAFDTSH